MRALSKTKLISFVIPIALAAICCLLLIIIIAIGVYIACSSKSTNAKVTEAQTQFFCLFALLHTEVAQTRATLADARASSVDSNSEEKKPFRETPRGTKCGIKFGEMSSHNHSGQNSGQSANNTYYIECLDSTYHRNRSLSTQFQLSVLDEHGYLNPCAYQAHVKEMHQPEHNTVACDRRENNYIAREKCRQRNDANPPCVTKPKATQSSFVFAANNDKRIPCYVFACADCDLLTPMSEGNEVGSCAMCDV